MMPDLSALHRRIGAIHALDNGDIAAVWISHDPQNDIVTVYDAFTFQGQSRSNVLPVVVEGLKARGQFPIAWAQEEMADELRKRGVFLIPEKVSTNETLANIQLNTMRTRYLTGRLKVKRDLQNWVAQYNTFKQSKDGKINPDDHPLMTATRYAVVSLLYARAPANTQRHEPIYRRIATV
ncbi:MAG: hypothetical protein AAF529_17595 [Pseudomonadota bacterium]